MTKKRISKTNKARVPKAPETATVIVEKKEQVSLEKLVEKEKATVIAVAPVVPDPENNCSRIFKPRGG